ncbi:MAG: mercury transporter MerT [Gammaproteobacteria bacterium]|nr:mercury transporter MerT [Gammaproteobacteria bacterium]
METTLETNREDTNVTPKWLAAGGLLAALAATTCCILPLAFTVLGVSGAWMSNLRAMAPYQPYFVTLSVFAIGFGFYQVYWKPRKVCAEEKVCARPIGGNIVKGSLWTGAVIVLGAVSFPLWFPFILPYLP